MAPLGLLVVLISCATILCVGSLEFQGFRFFHGLWPYIFVCNISKRCNMSNLDNSRNIVISLHQRINQTIRKSVLQAMASPTLAPWYFERDAKAESIDISLDQLKKTQRWKSTPWGHAWATENACVLCCVTRPLGSRDGQGRGRLRHSIWNFEKIEKIEYSN